MKNLIFLLIIVLLSIGCSSDDYFYGSQEDLTGTWILESRKLNDFPANNESCENIVISDDGSSVWTNCEGGIDDNLIFKGLNGNVNFEIDEIEFVSWAYQIGRFLSQNKIEITQTKTFNEEDFSTVYVFIRQ